MLTKPFTRDEYSFEQKVAYGNSNMATFQIDLSKISRKNPGICFHPIWCVP